MTSTLPPGPWRYVPDFGPRVLAADGTAVCYLPMDGNESVIGPAIAALPDLIAACEEMEQDLPKHAGKLRIPIIQKVFAALSKARGTDA